jgi:hypothetical protein
MGLKSLALHIVGVLVLFLKNGYKKVPTRVVLIHAFFLQDFFRILKNGQKKCPFFETPEIHPTFP